MTILATSHKLTQYSRSSNTMIDMGMEGLKQKKKRWGETQKGVMSGEVMMEGRKLQQAKWKEVFHFH